MRFHLQPGDTVEAGPTVVVIVLADSQGLTADTPNRSPTPDDVDLPVWPENDASFDYCVPRASRIRS